ncbi:MAG TPA: TfoX/Sxy family protein [Geobacterales bacterium]|nr:TfoX/Sxy family protein [Geobacterales bacterium]
MASQQSIADTIVEQLAGTGVTARKMFGEFGLFHEGKMVALICDDQLYVKPTGAGRAFLGDCPEGQPYPRSKPHFQIPGERWEDSEWLTKLIQLTASDLPPPKLKVARSKRGTR